MYVTSCRVIHKEEMHTLEEKKNRTVYVLCMSICKQVKKAEDRERKDTENTVIGEIRRRRPLPRDSEEGEREGKKRQKGMKEVDWMEGGVRGKSCVNNEEMK